MWSLLFRNFFFFLFRKKVRDMSEGEATNVRVMVRVRPFNKREIAISQKKKERLESCIRMRGDTVAVMEYTIDDKGFTHEKEREAFQFDVCFWSLPPAQGTSDLPFATQQYVYEQSGKIALGHLLQGFNVCIFAYGQTGSGKTHSMLGCDADPGMSPRLVDELFETLDYRKSVATARTTVDCMFFEIYNERVRDLFNKKQKAGEYDQPRIRQHPTKGVYVEGLKRNTVVDAAKTKELIEHGTNERAMAETKMNATSSRSHAVFQIQITQMDATKGTQTVSTINLVDLAGSEKVKMSGVTGDSFTEAKNINQSLSTLRRVIDVLIENSTSRHKKPAPFRESVLTYLLSDSLGGNSKTMMISAISPHESNLEDTLGTLRYALRAKAIVCNAKVNEEKSAAMMDAMKDELAALRERLATGGGGGGGQKMMPDEIKREIAIREEEMKKMEEAQETMNALLEESRKKEEEMAVQLTNVQEQQQQLTIAMNTQKRERFATAFRNAFLIAQDKQRIETSKAELEEAQARKEMMTRKAEELSYSLNEKSEALAKTEAQLKDTEAQLATLKAATEQHIAMLGKANRDLADDKAALQLKIEEQENELRKLGGLKQETEARLSRMQDDVLAATRKVEQVQKEKDYVKETLEQKTEESEGRYEELRKRKDKYKSLYFAEQSRNDSLRMLTQEKTGDKASLLNTIKAQQQLLSERETLIARLQEQLDKAEAISRNARSSEERKEEELVIMTEALEEYQAASTKWMADHSAMEKELLHLRQHYGHSGAGAAAIHTARTGLTSVGGSVTPIARRAQSPSASVARSPHFRQPVVTKNYLGDHSPTPTKPRWSHV